MRTELRHFKFTKTGYGHYEVVYTSPKTGKQWKCTTDDMHLIDHTLGSDNPNQNELNILKRRCKYYDITRRSDRL